MENKVQEFRRQLDMSQEELAAESLVGRSTISNIETEKYIPGVDIAIRISRALGHSVEDVFIEQDKERN